MYKILFFITMLFILPSKATCEEDTLSSESFFVGFEDLPLMNGLAQMIDDGMSFDAPEGRIAEAYAKSNTVKEKKLFRFYTKSLTQLGWEKTEKHGNFTREGENLSIDVIEKNPELIIRFRLSPASKEINNESKTDNP